VKANPPQRGERGIYYTLRAIDIALVVLTNIFTHSRNATRASLCLSHSFGHRDANLVCRTGPRHRNAISCQPHQLTTTRLSSWTGSDHQSHVHVLLSNTPTVHLPTPRPSGQLTVRRGGHIRWVLTAPKTTMLDLLPFILPDTAGLKELYHLSTYCKLP